MIYYLHEDARECAKMLDDKSLDKQIKAIAETLCDAHYDRNYNGWPIPLKPADPEGTLATWVRECRANYEQLVKTGLACLNEYEYRFIIGCGCNNCDERDKKLLDFDNKYREVIEWARDHEPNLSPSPGCAKNAAYVDNKHLKTTPFPLCVPNKYKTEMLVNYYDDFTDETKQQEIIKSYRNCCLGKIKDKMDDIVGGESDPEVAFRRKLQILGLKWTRRKPPKELSFDWHNNIP